MAATRMMENRRQQDRRIADVSVVEAATREILRQRAALNALYDCTDSKCSLCAGCLACLQRALRLVALRNDIDYCALHGEDRQQPGYRRTPEGEIVWVKRCTRCGLDKLREAFGTCRHNTDGVRQYCRACSAMASRNRYAAAKRLPSQPVTELRQE